MTAEHVTSLLGTILFLVNGWYYSPHFSAGQTEAKSGPNLSKGGAGMQRGVLELQAWTGWAGRHTSQWPALSSAAPAFGWALCPAFTMVAVGSEPPGSPGLPRKAVRSLTLPPSVTSAPWPTLSRGPSSIAPKLSATPPPTLPGLGCIPAWQRAGTWNRPGLAVSWEVLPSCRGPKLEPRPGGPPAS